jgi:hypothetical protein
MERDSTLKKQRWITRKKLASRNGRKQVSLLKVFLIGSLAELL